MYTYVIIKINEFISYGKKKGSFIILWANFFSLFIDNFLTLFLWKNNVLSIFHMFNFSNFYPIGKY